MDLFIVGWPLIGVEQGMGWESHMARAPRKIGMFPTLDLMVFNGVLMIMGFYDGLMVPNKWIGLLGKI